jgi:hypothetical protein
MNQGSAGVGEAASLSERDKLQMLVAQCLEIAKSFPVYQFHFSAAFAIALGWTLTSKDTRAFIVANVLLARTAASILCATLLFCHSFWVHRHYRRAELVHAELAEFAEKVFPEGKCFLASLRVDPFLPWIYLVINVSLCGATVFAVWRTV